MASVYRRTPLADSVAARLRRHDRRQPRRPVSHGPRRRPADAHPAGDDGIKGKIVIIGDWATDRPYKDYLPYLVAKGGLTTMTLALAKELAPHIPVAMIQPAMIDPPPDFTEAEKAGRARSRPRCAASARPPMSTG